MFFSPTHLKRLWALICFVACATVGGNGVAAPLPESAEKDRMEALPGRLAGVQIKEQLGADLRVDAALTDSGGKPVRLSQYFNGVRPVVLTFNYSNCPMLCSLQLTRFVQALTQLKRTAGTDFDIVTISIDPAETAKRASETKARYIRDYGRPEAASGWHFLLGSEDTVRQIANSVGFSYSYNEERKEWLHAAALMVLTPEGKVARYIYGVDYHPETLNLSLVESSQGKIGSTMDRLVLYCFHYDETEGRYAPVAMNIMRVGAGLVAVALGAFLAAYWVAESRKKRLLTSPSGHHVIVATNHGSITQSCVDVNQRSVSQGSVS